MSFFIIEDSGLIITQLLYKMALLITVLRWIFSFILRYRSRSTSSAPSISSQAIKESLSVTTFSERYPESISDTCAVCLGDLEDGDEVRELRNCSHVFHRECIDRWLDYECDDDINNEGEEDNHRTCPLCRTPLLAANTSSSCCGEWPAKNEPSWAVERLLYLFGDDLLN
ncbi:RING/U-box superfamily protein [Raphanus sativus]|uniref:Brassinosteroid-responsive RING protein 1 n=1 Tax=Raphanus sativus TaxID=3726 RepID=A0A6J0MSV6_RAPSA|nr:brassinosteroid-responsive RING protein 1 [Raphanus sativus]KAJ4908049.1 RING/U-box superfamily protein [Raphanus sativus]